jgi:hypothetical protein
LTPHNLFFIFSRCEKIKNGNFKGVQGNWFPCRVWAEPKVFIVSFFNSKTSARDRAGARHTDLAATL